MLITTNLIGFGSKFRAVVPSVSLDATANYTITSANSNSSSRAIGAAAADRIVVIGVSGVNATSDAGITSVTIGGVTAARVANVTNEQDTPGQYAFSEFWWALVPTGTTATIALTYTGLTIFAGIAVYRLAGANTTTPFTSTNTGSVASGNVSAAITPDAKSATVATAYCGINTSNSNTTWTNITENVDQSINIGSFLIMSHALRVDSASPGSITPTAANAASLDANKTISVGSMSPA